MIDDKHRNAAGGVIFLVLAALAVGRLVWTRVLDRDLADLDPPDWLRWAGPALGAGKLLWLAALGMLTVLAVIGEWSRRRRNGDPR